MAERVRLQFHRFGEHDPLGALGGANSRDYLRCYLADLGATVVIEEPFYFDRDYLAEYAAFYCTSARGYGNLCRRLHFFAGEGIDRGTVERAAGDAEDALLLLREGYLGFAVVRPFSPPRLGRTVLRWYSDVPPKALGPRVTASRNYRVHLAGIPLEITGLAWQQQDTGVGTCSTVALWSMLHSSAFDDHHAIPTTAAITQAASRHGSWGARVFPSTGLTAQQLGEAVQAHGLSPILVQGDLGVPPRFSRRRLATNLAAFIRSGYPVLVAGQLVRRDGSIAGKHAVCATGFRTAPAPDSPAGEVVLADGNTAFVYLHDDNLGPNVRFKIEEVQVGNDVVAQLTPDAPSPRGANPGYPDPTPRYPALIPSFLLVAVHNELRTSPDALHRTGLQLGKVLSGMLAGLIPDSASETRGLQISSRFIGLREYMREELPRLLAGNPAALSRVRLALLESVPPMSLHLGLVRIGLAAQPLLDIVYDTTDSDRGLRAFAHITFLPGIAELVNLVAGAEGAEIGVAVDSTELVTT